jgi:hypothetical protein
MKDWTEGEMRWIALEAIGEHYRRYRLPDTAAEAAMASSLGRYGQLSPLAVCLRQERPEVLDGFKRVAAGRFLLSPRSRRGWSWWMNRRPRRSSWA